MSIDKIRGKAPEPGYGLAEFLADLTLAIFRFSVIIVFSALKHKVIKVNA